MRSELRRLPLSALLVVLAPLAAGCAGESSRLAEVRLPERAASGSDPAIAIVPRSDDLLLAWLGGEGAERRLWFASSRDAGVTWTAPVAVSPPGERLGSGEAAAPRLACDAQDRVALVWIALGDSAGSGSARFARSLDHGRTWSAAVSLVGDATGPGAAGHLDAVSSDEGQLLVTWLEPPPGATAADSSSGATARARLARSQDFGGEWAAVTTSWAHACPRCRAIVGLDLVGSVFVAFRRHGPDGVRDVVLAGLEGAPVRAFADRWSAAECPEAGPSLTVARDGTLRVAWYTGAPGRTGVWFRQGIPETYDSTVTPLAVLAREGLAPVHVATGDAGRLGTLVACDADSAGAGGLTLVRIEASGRRVRERLAAPGVRGAAHPRLAASNTSPRAYVAWTERVAGAPARVRLYRWDVGR